MLSLILSTVPSFAFADDCYLHEIDPQTKRVYQNEAQWKADQDKLWAAAPPSPSLYRLKKGYDVAISESGISRGIGSDKRKHCYVGCRIANDVGHDVAVFAAYYKENKDLLDCNSKTHYDLADIPATVRGADLAMASKSPADKDYCWKECRRTLK